MWVPRVLYKTKGAPEMSHKLTFCKMTGHARFAVRCEQQKRDPRLVETDIFSI